MPVLATIASVALPIASVAAQFLPSILDTIANQINKAEKETTIPPMVDTGLVAFVLNDSYVDQLNGVPPIVIANANTQDDAYIGYEITDPTTGGTSIRQYLLPANSYMACSTYFSQEYMPYTRFFSNIADVTPESGTSSGTEYAVAANLSRLLWNNKNWIDNSVTLFGDLVQGGMTITRQFFNAQTNTRAGWLINVPQNFFFSVGLDWTTASGTKVNAFLRAGAGNNNGNGGTTYAETGNATLLPGGNQLIHANDQDIFGSLPDITVTASSEYILKPIPGSQPIPQGTIDDLPLRMRKALKRG